MTGELPPDELARRVWHRLAPEGWPVSPDALPPGSALVGGAVRDALLGRLGSRPDLDLVVPAGAIGLCRRLAQRLGGTCVVLDQPRDIARLVVNGWTLDLAGRDGPSLESDLQRRDYTANAIALRLDNPTVLVDPTGGLADLAAGRLAAVSEANLLADPLRLLRGVRLSHTLDLPLAALSQDWIRHHAQTLGQVAGERVFTELEKLAADPRGHQGLAWSLRHNLLAAWGADPNAGRPLTGLGPEQAGACGLDASERAWALPLARLATLLPPAALGRLRASRQWQQRSARLRCWWQELEARPGPEALAEPRRLQLHGELEADLPALLLRLPPAVARPWMARWRQPEDCLFHPRSPLDGRQLQQALNLPPGPLLGELIRHLTLERAFGRIPVADPAAGAVAIHTARAWLSRRRD
ncbi:CCA tRNA nucleotidyltransferase [Cyanobium sp. NIES-981]|uniref:CCA tRNA nucleotidyltransferase n=1 Tax=Cyanobium sp. NIES-981 TaxID=1851505 RepID=UPI0007DDCCA1|nr:CCA tRNA nucleotidyltransferase [Cyanobium sp. NIES-981]SBO44837.1 Poly A polymerase family [Cyanobium sp. NIES-981]